MKNFEMYCPIEGTSALQPNFKTGKVITFPSRSAFSCEPDSSNLDASVASLSSFSSLALNSEMAQSLRYGSARGCPFERVKPWQAVVTGILFSSLSLASVFLSL